MACGVASPRSCSARAASDGLQARPQAHSSSEVPESRVLPAAGLPRLDLMPTTRDLTFEVWSSADHLEGAAALLRARHVIHRAAHPELPELDREWSRQLLSACVDGAGYVARRDGRVVGYLTATAITEGPRAGLAWSDLNDHAAVDAETTRSLYAHAAEQWVAAGLRQ